MNLYLQFFFKAQLSDYIVQFYPKTIYLGTSPLPEIKLNNRPHFLFLSKHAVTGKLPYLRYFNVKGVFGIFFFFFFAFFKEFPLPSITQRLYIHIKKVVRFFEVYSDHNLGQS